MIPATSCLFSRKPGWGYSRWLRIDACGTLFAQAPVLSLLDVLVSRRMGQIPSMASIPGDPGHSCCILACVGIVLTGFAIFSFWGVCFNPLVLLVATFLGSVMFALGKVLHSSSAINLVVPPGRMRVTYGLSLSLWLGRGYPLAAWSLLRRF